MLASVQSPLQKSIFDISSQMQISKFSGLVQFCLTYFLAITLSRIVGKKFVSFMDTAILKSSEKAVTFFKNTQKLSKTYPILLEICIFLLFLEVPLIF